MILDWVLWNNDTVSTSWILLTELDNTTGMCYKLMIEWVSAM